MAHCIKPKKWSLAWKTCQVTESMVTQAAAPLAKTFLPQPEGLQLQKAALEGPQPHPAFSPPTPALLAAGKRWGLGGKSWEESEPPPAVDLPAAAVFPCFRGMAVCQGVL